MKNLIQKYYNFNAKVISAPFIFLKNPKIPTYIKILVVSSVVGVIAIFGTRAKNGSSTTAYENSQIIGTYVAEQEQLGVKVQAELVLNENKTFKATTYYDGQPSKGGTTLGVWKLVVLKDSIFDLGKLKEIQTNNFLECTDNVYHSSSKYKIDLPQITAFSIMSGTTSDVLFGGLVNDVALRKR